MGITENICCALTHIIVSTLIYLAFPLCIAFLFTSWLEKYAGNVPVCSGD